MTESDPVANPQTGAALRRGDAIPGSASDAASGEALTSPWAEDVSLRPAAAAFGGWLEAGCAVLDAFGVVSHVNEALAEWLERPAEVLNGRPLRALLKERCPAWEKAFDDLWRGGGVFSRARLELPGPEGGPSRWYVLEVARYHAGASARLNSVLPPLSELEEGSWDEYIRSERAQLEMFLRMVRAEAQLKNLIERWPGVIFSQRADFTFRFVSPRIYALTGAGVDQWQQDPQLFWRHVHEGDAVELRRQILAAARSGDALSSTFRVRHAQTGRMTYVMEHRQPVLSRNGLLLGYEGVWLDVTRQTLAEKRLQSAAWKQTLSTLTTGLAHDFGNLMAGIHALSESFLLEEALKPECSEGLSMIKSNAHQASRLVHRIIDLHQGQPGQRYHHNLNDVMGDLADLARKITPRRIQFAADLAPVALPVYLDAVEFRQIVINLVLNAIEATPGEGRLVLRTAAHDRLPGGQRFHGAPPRLPAVSFTVEDTGCGIPASRLDQVFTPFFTTKAGNQSAGLGLYQARLFAERHRGAVSLASTEGAGTTLSVWLPQADFNETDFLRKQP
jgi:two-component system cell cycle sensor histidine kinase/response regulator CckA